MTNISLRLVIILLLVGLITSATLTVVDSTTDTQTIQIFSKDSDQYRWMVKRKLSTNAFSIESYRLDQAGTLAKITYAPGADAIIKAVSRGYTCGLVYDGTTPTKKLTTLNFAPASGTVASPVDELIATNRATDAIATSSSTIFEIAD